jgi:hypothetical protein
VLRPTSCTQCSPKLSVFRPHLKPYTTRVLCHTKHPPTALLLLLLLLLRAAPGAAVASVLLQPAVHRGVVSVSLGASGAIFGLFAVSVLTRLSWDPRKLLEGAILGQFVVRPKGICTQHCTSATCLSVHSGQVSHSDSTQLNSAPFAIQGPGMQDSATHNS